MKKLIFSFFLFSFSFANAQQVSDFKYVIVPSTFIDFEKEDYQLNTYLKTLLRKKKYEIIVDGSTDIPLDLKLDKCLATKADIQNIKSSFQNKLKVVFKDCNDNTLSEYDGVSKIKDFEKGYQEALNLAMIKLPLQNAKENIKPTITVKKTDSNLTIETEDIVNKPKTESNISVSNQRQFESNGKTYQLIEISTKKSKLIDLQSQKVIAIIYPSSKENILHIEAVSAQGNYNTLGYSEGKNLIIEFKAGNENWSKTEFKSK